MKFIGFLILLASASAAQGEVKSSTAAGFEVERKGRVAATPDETYAALGRIGAWWNDGHTYSGDAANMTIELKVGGCFCEALPKSGGAVEPGRVIHARPGETLRLQGGLGPLQAEAVVGVLTWSLKPVEGGTEIAQTYVVGGYVRGGAERLAPLVDQVLGEQFDGLREHLAR